MKARRIDLTDYEFEVMKPGTGDETEMEPVKVRKILGNLICHVDLKLKPKQLVKNGLIANSFDGDEDFIDLDADQYNTVTKALDKIVPLIKLGRMHVEMLRRVYEAEEIDMEPVKQLENKTDDDSGDVET